MLSAKELMAIKAGKSKPKCLPSVPPKEFNPTFSSQEKNHIRFMIDERLSFVKEERAERKGLLSKADWLTDDGLVRVERPLGSGYDHFGFHRNGILHLYPEEAIHLLEVMKIEIWYGKAPMSIQQSYDLLLQPQFCTAAKFKVYSHLTRQGYKVKRRTHLKTLKRTVPSEQQTLKRSRKDSLCRPITLLPTAADSDILNSIPNFGENDSIKLQFENPQLLPESCRNRLECYSFSREQFKISHTQLSRTNSVLESDQEKIGRAGPNSLYDGITKPLLPSAGVSDLLSHLAIFSGPQASTESCDAELRIDFDVYSPGQAHRKRHPDFSVAVTDWHSPFPTLVTLNYLLSQCSEQTTLLVAVTGHGSDVAFYQLSQKTRSPCPM